MNSKNVKKVASILELSNGAVLKKIDQAYATVLDNIRDINTDPKKKRQIVITMTVTSDAERKNQMIESKVVTKLVPSDSIRMNLFDMKINDEETGEIKHVQAEATYQIPGQMNLDGEVNVPNVYIPSVDGKAN
jgi:hypothetical protein